MLSGMGVVYILVFVLGADSLREFLKWLDFLSAAPGLSGLAILLAVPPIFLALCFALHWIILGFKRNPDPATVDVG
jgi:hypothetical protein